MIYRQAAKALIAEGKARDADFPATADGFKAPQDDFIDGIVYRRAQAQRVPREIQDRPEGRRRRLTVTAHLRNGALDNGIRADDSSVA